MLSKFLTLFAVLAFVSAAPAPSAAEKRFKLPVVHRRDARKAPLHQRVAKRAAHLAKRYGKLAPGQLVKRGSTINVLDVDSFLVVDDVVYDEGPNLNVSVGTPPQEVLAIIDTGSFNFEVYADGSLTGPHTLFNTSASSTYISVNNTPIVSMYTGGDNIGVIGADTVAVNGISVANQTIFVNTFSNQSALSSISGVFGVVPIPGTSPPNTPVDPNQPNETAANWLYNSYKAGAFDQPMFALSPLESGRDIPFIQQQFALNATNGTSINVTFFDTQPSRTLEIGGYNNSYQPQYVPVVENGSWTVDFTSFSVNGKPVAGVGGPTSIDSGTTTLTFNFTDAQAIADAIGGRLIAFDAVQGFDFLGGQGTTWLAAPCDNKVLDFSIEVANQSFKLNLADLFIDTIDEAGTECLLEINALDFPTQIIGDVLLKNAYAIFDFSGGQPSRIGFAPPKTPVPTGQTLGGLSSAHAHTGLLYIDGLPQSDVNGDIPIPSGSGQVGKRRRRVSREY